MNARPKNLFLLFCKVRKFESNFDWVYGVTMVIVRLFRLAIFSKEFVYRLNNTGFSNPILS